MDAAAKMSATLDDLLARLDEPCIVCMIGAKHSDGRKGDAYIGASLQFDTLDADRAKVFPRHLADDYADHWRGWYRGFAGGCTIEVRLASEYQFNPGGAWCPLDAAATLRAQQAAPVAEPAKVTA